MLAHENASQVELQMARGDRLVPTYMSFYVRAENDTALRRQVNHVESLLLQNGLQTVGRESEFLACDAWLRNLPMNYDPALDRSHRRSRLMFRTHLTSLLPVYGRSRGTGHPGSCSGTRWRAAELRSTAQRRPQEERSHADRRADRRRQIRHAGLPDHAGAGRGPRVYLIEAGNSFGLMCDYLRSHACPCIAWRCSPTPTSACRRSPAPCRCWRPIDAGQRRPGGRRRRHARR